MNCSWQLVLIERTMVIDIAALCCGKMSVAYGDAEEPVMSAIFRRGSYHSYICLI